MRVAKAKKQIAPTSATLLVAKPIHANAIHIEAKPATSGYLLSKREINQPETGRPSRELTGIKSSIVPSWASLNSNVLLMVGILEAQLAKQNPERKKNEASEIRCRCLRSIIRKSSANMQGYAELTIGFTQTKMRCGIRSNSNRCTALLINYPFGEKIPSRILT